MSQLAHLVGRDDVPPWTSFAVESDRDVLPGDGSLEVAPSGSGGGRAWSLPASGAVFAGRTAVFVLPGGLSAGTRYAARATAGLLQDAEGRRSEASELGSFATLAAGATDALGPGLLASEAYGGPQPGRAAGVRLWFSEPIQAGGGSLVLRTPDGSDVSRPADGAGVVIAGVRVEVPLLGADDLAGGSYSLSIGSGVFRDLGSGGGNANQASVRNFEVPPTDSHAPAVTAVSPPDEGQEVAASSPAVLLSFSEAVQLGSARGVFFEAGDFLVPALHIASGRPGGTIHVAGSGAAVFAESLRPGVNYSIRVEPGAFLDAAGNEAAEHISHLVVAQQLRFAPTQTSGPPRGHLTLPPGQTLGGFAVDEGNNILLVASAALGSPQARRLQDASSAVSLLPTARPVDCADGELAPSPCSRTACEGSPPTLGSRTVRRVVWRAATVGGRLCRNAAGEAFSDLGDVVEERREVCPCPRCPEPPGEPLPANLADLALVRSYGLTFSDVQPRELPCKPGYRSTGRFHCRSLNRFNAAWETPYPACVPLDCLSPPPDLVRAASRLTREECSLCSGEPQENVTCTVWPLDGNESFNASDPVDESFNASDPVDSLPHGAACNATCLPGFMANETFRCLFGAYNAPVCVHMQCLSPPAAPPNGTVDCDAGPLLTNSRCRLACAGGFRLKGGAVTRCEGRPEAPRDAPQWTPFGRCVRRSCGPPPEPQDPYGEVDDNTSTLFGDRAALGCAQGFQLTLESDAELTCEATTLGSSVRWTGSLVCEARPCPVALTDPLGAFVCTGGTSRRGDQCQLRCPVGALLQGGNGTFLCDGERWLGDGACGWDSCEAPPLPKDAIGLAPECASLEPGDTCRTLCRAAYHEVGVNRCGRRQVYAERSACVFAGGVANPQVGLHGFARLFLRSSLGALDPAQLAEGPLASGVSDGMLVLGLERLLRVDAWSSPPDAQREAVHLYSVFSGDMDSRYTILDNGLRLR